MCTVYIYVKYPNGGYEIVKNNILDSLINSNKIVEFKRASGWVKVGVDPLRKTKRDHTAV